MQVAMPKVSGSSISELSSFHYQSLICSPSVNKTPNAVQRSSAFCVEDQPSPFKVLNKTPRAVQRSSASCVEDQPSPFKLLEDDSKSLFPLVEHCELPSISPDLLKSILTRERDFPKDGLVIIDTRHKFEYSGGHIHGCTPGGTLYLGPRFSIDLFSATSFEAKVLQKGQDFDGDESFDSVSTDTRTPELDFDNGAVNLNGPNCVEEFYTKNLTRGKDLVIIFHCEFSSARAPKLFRHMRNLDRQRHIEVYPALGFPHMYILHGGYKAFFDLHSDLCEPRQYVRMADPLHAEDLRASNRILKRSWSARSKNSKNCRIRTQEDVLTDVSNLSKRTDVNMRSCSACLTFGA